MPDMLVRYKKGKTTYEVLVEEGKVTKYREGEIKNLSEVLGKLAYNSPFLLLQSTGILISLYICYHSGGCGVVECQQRKARER